MATHNVPRPPMPDALRALRFLAILAALAWAGDMALGHLAGTALLRSQNRFSLLYAGKAETDILVLGNSRAVNAFHAAEVSRRTGERCFNLAYNGASAEVADCLLHDYLARYPAPRLVALEASALTSGAAVASKFMAFHEVSPCLAELTERAFPETRIPARLSRLYRFNSEFFLRSFAYLARDDQGWINEGTLTPAMEAALRRTPATPWRFSEENLAALSRMAALARGFGTKLIVLMAPIHPAGRARFENLAAWTEEARTRCEALGVPFLDYTRALDPDETSGASPAAARGDTGFADGIHLNLAGSHALLDRMLADGVFAPAP